MLPFLQQRLDADCPELSGAVGGRGDAGRVGLEPTCVLRPGPLGSCSSCPPPGSPPVAPAAAWPTSARPAPDHPVWDPATHLAIAVPFMCANLRLVTAHLHATGKPTSPLDALAVCHIAGCSRVIGSATGIPRPGEAGCDSGCVQQVTAYLAAIHRYVEAFAAPVPAPQQRAAQERRSPIRAERPAVSSRDPSGTGGCVTGALAWLMGQVAARFGHLPVACWSGRGGDPYSDHPKGKACDYTMGRIGAYAGPADVARGWSLAFWLRANASAARQLRHLAGPDLVPGTRRPGLAPVHRRRDLRRLRSHPRPLRPRPRLHHRLTHHRGRNNQ